MSLLKLYQGRALQTALAQIVRPVRVTYGVVDQPEPDTVQALADLVRLAPRVKVETVPEPDRAADRIIVQSIEGCRLLFTGAPVGTELAALVSAVIISGRGDSGLAESTRAALARLQSPVYVAVFTGPT